MSFMLCWNRGLSKAPLKYTLELVQCLPVKARGSRVLQCLLCPSTLSVSVLVSLLCFLQWDSEEAAASLSFQVSPANSGEL